MIVVETILLDHAGRADLPGRTDLVQADLPVTDLAARKKKPRMMAGWGKVAM